MKTIHTNLSHDNLTRPDDFNSSSKLTNSQNKILASCFIPLTKTAKGQAFNGFRTGKTISTNNITIHYITFKYFSLHNCYEADNSFCDS